MSPSRHLPLPSSWQVSTSGEGWRFGRLPQGGLPPSLSLASTNLVARQSLRDARSTFPPSLYPDATSRRSFDVAVLVSGVEEVVELDELPPASSNLVALSSKTLPPLTTFHPLLAPHHRLSNFSNLSSLLMMFSSLRSSMFRPSRSSSLSTLSFELDDVAIVHDKPVTALQSSKNGPRIVTRRKR